MASASDFARKPHFLVQEPASTILKIPSKSHSNSVCKSFVIVLVLAAIPLFPSQAPEFISQSIFAECWEIIHLLFIGIALSYGLFCRRSSQIDTDWADSRNDGFNADFSGFLNVSSVFDDGFENMCGSDEKNMIPTVKDRTFLVSENGPENVCQSNWKEVSDIQTWNYRYFEGKSMVVVDNGEHFLDKCINCKPLNLPIRSLRSRIVDNDKLELVNRSDTAPNSEVSCKNIDKVEVQKIRGVVPQNLEKKFVEASEQPPPICWRTRAQSMEMQEAMVNREPVKHSRPLSVGDSEFEHIEPWSFGDPTPSASPELPRSNVKNMERKKNLKWLSVSGSRSRVAPLKTEESVAGSKTRPFSIGSSLEMNMLRDSNDNLMDCGNEDGSTKGKEDTDSWVSNVKLSKVLSKARSVRTIRSSRYMVDEMQKEKSSSQVEDYHVGFTRNKLEQDTLVKRNVVDELEDSAVSTKNQDMSSGSLAPNSSFPSSGSSAAIGMDFQTRQWELNTRVAPKYDKGGNQVIDDHNEIDCEDYSESEFDPSSDSEDAGTYPDYNAELEGSEVDRKAGEFIAKFREQIRLQKIASSKGFNG